MNDPLVYKHFVIVFSIFSLVAVSKPLYSAWEADYHKDFQTRYNEVMCLREGINPYDIWSENIKHSRYIPLNRYVENYVTLSPSKRANQTEGLDPYAMVHAYTPWQYSYFYPLALIRHENAQLLFLSIQILSLGLICMAMFIQGVNLRGSDVDGLLMASLAISGGMLGAIKLDTGVGNYGITTAALAVLLAFLLDRDKEYLAGLCWALMMAKPQIGALFFFPILFDRRFKTIATTTIICALATIPPSLMCNENPIALILNFKEAGSAYFTGTGFFPPPIIQHLAETENQLLPWVMPISALLGLGYCLGVSFITKTQNWFMRFTPIALCSMFWTYSLRCDRILLVFVLYLFVRTCLLHRLNVLQWAWMGLALIMVMLDVTILIRGDTFASFLHYLPKGISSAWIFRHNWSPLIGNVEAFVRWPFLLVTTTWLLYRDRKALPANP